MRQKTLGFVFLSCSLLWFHDKTSWTNIYRYSYSFYIADAFLIQPIFPTTVLLRNDNGYNKRHYMSVLWSANTTTTTSTTTKVTTSDNNDLMDDETLLKTVTKSQLVELCEKCNVSVKGTKVELLHRLRQHANQQAEQAKQRKLQRRVKVEDGEGIDNIKERYEIVGGQNNDNNNNYYVDDDDDEGYFFFEIPTSKKGKEENKKQKKSQTKTTTTNSNNNNTTYITQQTLTAPLPPPDIKPNEDGERVVTVYSTTEQNDLTGIAAAQPGQQQNFDALTNTVASQSSQSQPWDVQNQKTTETTSKELQQAKEKVTELVALLLEMTGAPAFVTLNDDDDDDDDGIDFNNYNSNSKVFRRKQPSATTTQFVGFDPSKVSNDMLSSYSQALRAGRGEVLQDVLRQYEIQAIGQDGMAGDDKEKGGGHYREVNKVRAFLTGYRKAEVRRIAKETTTILLDKLVQEGVEGLDLTLSTMIRSNDDTTSDEYSDGCILNDSLIDFLNDAIRQQERKVDDIVSAGIDAEKLAQNTDNIMNNDNNNINDDHQYDNLWNVTIDEDGERIEVIDPNEPRVQEALRNEVEKQRSSSNTIATTTKPTIPDNVHEKLLLLLSLLRDRIKAEAAFAPDEKGRNLRLLAYCLRIDNEKEREQLMLKDIGNSLDRLDSFIELVTSSIEYGESTAYTLQPTSTKSYQLNIPQLKHILKTAKDLRTKQELRASGLKVDT